MFFPSFARIGSHLTDLTPSRVTGSRSAAPDLFAPTGFGS